MAKVNIDKMYFAKITQDDSTGLTFSTPEYIPGVRSMTVRVNQTTEKLYAEGKVWDQDTTMEDVSIDFDLAELDNETYAEYLGHELAEEGGIYASESDTAPYIAILIETTKNNKKKAFRVYYKGKLTEPEEAVRGKEGSTQFQTHPVTATFQALRNNGMWKYAIDEDDVNAPTTIKDTFFDTVIIPTKRAVV